MSQRHGHRYDEYCQTIGAFLPACTPLIPTHATSRNIFAGIACVFVITGSFGCRAYSVSRIDTIVPTARPDVLVIAFDAPNSDIAKLTANRAIEALPTGDDTPELIYLIWEDDRVRHFLKDAGLQRDVLHDMNLPAAEVYLITATVYPPGRQERAAVVVSPRDMLRLGLIRRATRLYYKPHDDSAIWKELPWPEEALHPHASAPVL